MNIYFIEYTRSIKFFGNNGNALEIPKNKKTYKMIMKLKKDTRYNLINLI